MLFYGLKSKIAPLLSYEPLPTRGLTEKILALNDIAVILTASKNKIVHCSKSVEPILGIQMSDIVNHGWQIIFDRIHADDRKLLAKKLHPELRRQLRRLPPEEQARCCFNYSFRIRTPEGYTLVALENQRVQVSQRKASWAYMSVLKNISPYGARDRIILKISKRVPERGWLTLFEKTYRTKAEGFTRRETQIIHLIAEGLSSRQIGERLFISPETVRFHRKKLMQKAGCKSSAELVSRAIRTEML